MSQPRACSIPLAVYQRLRVLYLLERFSRGCYGSVRLQKVAYFSEKQSREKLFTFRKAPWGPYSEDLAQIVEQLLSMGLVDAVPRDKGQGNKYTLTSGADQGFSYHKWLAAIDPDDSRAIEEAVEQYGYLKGDAVIEAGHREKAFRTSEFYDVLLEASAEDLVEVRMEREDCDELVLSLSPGFVSRIDRLATAAQDFDFRKIPVS
jgi:uncharacterized protein YwgA